jgi:hypothetical protein
MTGFFRNFRYRESEREPLKYLTNFNGTTHFYVIQKEAHRGQLRKSKEGKLKKNTNFLVEVAPQGRKRANTGFTQTTFYYYIN